MAVSTPAEAVALMKDRFNKDAAAGVDGILQFDLGDAGKWAFKIGGDGLEVVEGGVDAPTTTLSMSDETFVGLSNGTVNGMTAFMSGQIKLDGDMTLAMSLQQVMNLAQD